MCGIAGILGEIWTADAWKECLTSMAGTLVHRGPDDEGIWFDEKMGIGLAHRRLSIIDLSPEGHQPMFSETGRYVMVYNGEVYNFQSIRKELESLGHGFRGHSDTEVMLAAIEEWGVEDALGGFNGMFAFAVWDRKESVLTLVRDRIGIKPLYYGWIDGTFVFASEMKTIRRHPDFRNEISRDALALFLKHNYIPSPCSIYRDIYKLLPGCLMKVPISGDDRRGCREKIVSYWSLEDAVRRRTDHPFTGNDREAAEELDAILRDSVRLRMIADVPLGAFLSGGIDSSIVVSLMQAQHTIPVQTFTIGFLEQGYDEAAYAKKIAGFLGTDHTELYITPKQALEVIPFLPSLYDEPFSDSSQIPTYLVAQLARREVTVSLSGDGGDELFGGYDRYSWGNMIGKAIGWSPSWLRKPAARFLLGISPGYLDRVLGPVVSFCPGIIRNGNAGDRLSKLAKILMSENTREMYLMLLSHWIEPSRIVKNSFEPSGYFRDSKIWSYLDDLDHKMMYLDTVSYLPDDILTKVDRASMGVSLEVRVPLLDYRVVENAWSMSLRMKVRNGKRKWLLHRILEQYLPKRFFERPKMGFGVPIDTWLRGPLREWAESLLNEKRILEEEYFWPGPIREKWDEHISGRCNWQYHLWDVLMFQAWLEYQKS